MPRRAPLICETPRGLCCEAGDFYIDPHRAVERAVITHAHSDHARRGSRQYLTTPDGLRVLKTRMGKAAVIETLPYGEGLDINGVRVSLHPAGHILGSAQVRVEYQGEVWVVSGDYKIDDDPTCRPFEPVTCHTFITESTFALPIYQWLPSSKVVDQINAWWKANRDDGVTSLIYGYSLGKSQRLIAGLDPSIGQILCHPNVELMNQNYRDTGIHLPPTRDISSDLTAQDFNGAMLIIPPGTESALPLSACGAIRTAVASGWMQTRKLRRGRSGDAAFVLSDHADWPGLISAVRSTAAERVLVTHGYVDPLVRWLNEQGIQAAALSHTAR